MTPLVVRWSLASGFDSSRHQVDCYLRESTWRTQQSWSHNRRHSTTETSHRYLQYHCWLLYCLTLTKAFVCLPSWFSCVGGSESMVMIYLGNITEYLPIPSLKSLIGSIQLVDCHLSQHSSTASACLRHLKSSAYLHLLMLSPFDNIQISKPLLSMKRRKQARWSW